MVSDESIWNCYPRAYSRYARPAPPDTVGQVTEVPDTVGRPQCRQFTEVPNNMCMAFRDYLKDLWTMFSVVVSC